MSNKYWTNRNLDAEGFWDAITLPIQMSNSAVCKYLPDTMVLAFQATHSSTFKDF